VRRANGILVTPYTTGNDDPAILRQRFTNHVQRIRLGTVDKTAGVYHHYIGVIIGGDYLLAFGAELSKDMLGIDQGLRTTEADETDFGA
jgi:hypothetical protein